VLVTTINAVFKIIAFKLVHKMKLKTVSGECNVSMVTVYVLTFFNTAVLLLMLCANFSESKIGILKNLLSVGKRSDWDTAWY
jgi:hypothetical protein